MVKVVASCDVDVDMIQPYNYTNPSGINKIIIGVKYWQDDNEYTNVITHNIGVLYDSNYYEVLNDVNLITQLYETEIVGDRMLVRKLKFPLVEKTYKVTIKDKFDDSIC